MRGKHALEKEILETNYTHILGDLNALQQADRDKRQRELGDIPRAIFLPAWQREQQKSEMQLNMERRFERIYEETNLRKEGDEVVPQPVDAESQSHLEDAELDLTLLDDANHVSGVLVSGRGVDEADFLPPKAQVTATGNTITVVTAPTASSNQSLTLPPDATTQTNSENTTLNKLLGNLFCLKKLMPLVLITEKI